MNKEERLMMSKEEARNRAKELLNENQVDLITKYMFLEQQCKKQKEVIDKAIEFIEKNSKQCLTNKIDEQPTKVIGKFMWHIDDLLDILKESGE